MTTTSTASRKDLVRRLAAVPLVRFATIGVISTLAYAALYVLLRIPLGPSAANALALALTAVANTQANRRFTFGVRGRRGLIRQHAAGALVYLLALGLTGGALDVLRGVDPHAGRATEVIVLILASALATITRYVALRSWVFAHRDHRPRSLRPLPH